MAAAVIIFTKIEKQDPKGPRKRISFDMTSSILADKKAINIK